MTKILLATVALCALALAGPVAAADLPSKAPIYKPLPVPTLYNWTGFYVGLYGGGGWGRHNASATGFSNGYNSNGGLIGALAGYNWQLDGPFVVGLEGDIAWASIRGTGTLSNGFSDSSNYRWLGSMRGRLGYAFDNWMLFGTGGWAFANISHSNSSGDNFSTTRSGWTVGGGVEYAFLRNWTARLDYRYYDFGSYSGATPLAYSVSNKLQTVTVGLSYKF